MSLERKSGLPRGRLRAAWPRDASLLAAARACCRSRSTHRTELAHCWDCAPGLSTLPHGSPAPSSEEDPKDTACSQHQTPVLPLRWRGSRGSGPAASFVGVLTGVSQGILLTAEPSWLPCLERALLLFLKAFFVGEKSFSHSTR